jgi:predicted ATPase
MSMLVTGASGAGTTTLGRALAQHWEVPHVDVEGRSLWRHETWLAARSCPVIRICGDHPLADLIARVVSELPNPGFERSRR